MRLRHETEVVVCVCVFLDCMLLFTVWPYVPCVGVCCIILASVSSMKEILLPRSFTSVAVHNNTGGELW